MRPFYSKNNLVLKIFLFIYPSILLVLCIYDVWAFNNILSAIFNDSLKCGLGVGLWILIAEIDTIGKGTAYLVSELMERYFELPESALTLNFQHSFALCSVWSALLDRACMHGSSDDLYKKKPFEVTKTHS